MADATLVPINVVGGINYTAPSYNYGQTSQAINGGYSFDLPLASVAAFTNSALSFSQQNTINSQGFLSGVIGQQQGALTNVNNQALTFNNNALTALQNMFSQNMQTQQYIAKKKYASSGCFITTAVTKAAGEPDDGPTLQLLRKFRDDVLTTTDEGKAIIAKYYEVAPVIVAAIDASPTRDFIYTYLLRNFINVVVGQIATGNNEGAVGTYTAMVNEANKLAGSPVDLTVPVVVAPIEPPPFHPIGD